MIDNFTQLTVTFFNLSVSEKLMGAIWAGLKALGTELVADVLPPIIVMLMRLMTGATLAWNPARREQEILPILVPQKTSQQDAESCSGTLPGLRSNPAQDSTRIAVDSGQFLAIPDQLKNPDPDPQPVAQDTDRECAGILVTSGDQILLPNGLDEASLSDVKSWVENCIDGGQDHGARILYGDAYGHYQKWCGVRRKKPVCKPAFGLAMAKLGWPKMKIGGQFQFVGAAFKSQPTLKMVRG
jgi:hypothetical protein